jgi:hypothetical protein
MNTYPEPDLSVFSTVGIEYINVIIRWCLVTGAHLPLGFELGNGRRVL